MKEPIRLHFDQCHCRRWDSTTSAWYYLLIKSFLLILFSMWFQSIYAHGDLHERILAATQEIKNSPDSAFLYLKRGELYYQHGDYNESLDDFKKCSELSYHDDRLSLAFAKSYLKLEYPDISLTHVNQILQRNERNVIGLKWKGQALKDLKQYDEAALAYEAVIEFVDKTIPENYLDAADVWELSGSKSSFNNAVNILLKGIDKLGPLLTLYQRLMILYSDNHDYKKAIYYQNKIVESVNRKEIQYYQRALLEIEAGNLKSADLDLEKAKKAIESLPERIKRTKAMKVLHEDILRAEIEIIKINCTSKN